jgi:hypothetical protein
MTPFTQFPPQIILYAGHNVSIIKVETINPWTNISDGYLVEGKLLTDLVVGGAIDIERTKSSKHGMDKEVMGQFQSSPVRSFQTVHLGFRQGIMVRTENSLYFIKVLPC